MRPRDIRIVFAALLAAASAGVFAAFAGPGASSISDEYQYGKTTICHRTGTETNPFVTIEVSENAVDAHLRHGDTLGPCQP